MYVKPESTEIFYSDGWKYRVEKFFRYKLKNDLKPNRQYVHPNGYYFLEMDGVGHWWIQANAGCMWDGPSGPMPDYDFMYAPSLIHDILHWLIAKGVISEDMNDMIDKELKDAINHYTTPMPWWQGGASKTIKKWRAALIYKATNFVSEKAGNKIQVKRVKLR